MIEPTRVSIRVGVCDDEGHFGGVVASDSSNVEYLGASKKAKDDAGARPKERQTGKKDLAAWIEIGAWAGGLIDGKIRERSNASYLYRA